MCSLLCLLPLAAGGQTTAPKVRTVLRHPGTSWGRMLWDGGMVRQKEGPWYLTLPDGYGDLIVMNFVDGYSYGPHAIIGYMTANRQRWEVEETVRWASGRDRLLAKGALRWYSPVEQARMVEVHGGRHTEDFDHDPTMPESQSLLATGLFGWNHYKLLERTDAGIRLALPLGNDLSMKASASWERRRQQENHRQTNVFGAHAQSNVPRLRDGNTASHLELYEGPIDGQIALLGLQFDYRPQSRYMVYDDMTCRASSRFPLFTLRADAGVGDWDYLSFDLRISQTLALSRRQDQLQYLASVGGMVRHGEVGLADWHHFDASRFWWQASDCVSRFVMLDNYELSTDRAWVEAHAEWTTDRMLLSQLTRDASFLQEYVQVHAVQVPQHRCHCEFAYGIDFARMIRLGFAVGFDRLTFRGAAFTLVIRPEEVARHSLL